MIETRLDETLAALPGAIKVAISEALEGVARVGAVEALAAQVAAQSAAIQALQNAQAFGAGAGNVEQRVRSQAQEWARLIFPYLLSLAGLALGWRWLDGA